MSDQEPDPGDAPGVETAESFADAAESATPTGFATEPSEQPELPTDVGNPLGSEPVEQPVEQPAEIVETVGIAENAGIPVNAGIDAGIAATAEKKKKKRSGRRAGWAIGLGMGYVVLAAGTAFGVIIDKSPAPVDVTAVNASAYAVPVGSASATASAKSGTGAKPSASATTAAPTTPAASPTPTSTVTGSVSDGIHRGDLRFFLLPPPQGPSSVQGDPDGTTDTLAEAVAAYDGDSSQESILKDYGFKAACDRVFQDSAIGANVSIELIQFKSSSDAEQWTESFGLDGSGFAGISVPGASSAKGWSYAKDGSYTLIGMEREGDTFFEIDVYGTQPVPAADLGKLVNGQHSRLANG